MHDNLIRILLIFLGLSIFITYFLIKIKVHPIIGFIVTGAIIGPNGFKLIDDPTMISAISEIGVILLLFSLGLEFSIDKLIRLRRYVFWGGMWQVFGTFVIFVLIVFFLFGSAKIAIVLGILSSLSSTAILIKLISEKGLTDAPFGKVGIGILLFQDIMVVPIMVIVPLLAANSINFADILIKISKSLFLGVLVFFVSKYFTTYLLSKIVKLRVRELFVFTVMAISFGMAYLTDILGISMSMGAFIAGVVLADSIYTHQIITDIQSFKDSFLALFFISIGLLTDPIYIIHNYGKILLFLLALLIIKGSIVFAVSYYLLKSPRIAFKAGLSLFQIGEFSFVVAALCKNLNIIDNDIYQLFLGGSVFSMILTPYGFKYGYKIYDLLFKRVEIETIKNANEEALKDHVIIIGYGLNGRNLSHVLKDTDIRYVICDMNVNTVREMSEKGEPIIFGDATNEEILHLLGIKTAKLLVVAISDPEATKRIVKTSRSIREDIVIIVRTRYVAEVDVFRKLGADEIIPEEFETSIEIFSRVLTRYHVPTNVIHLLVRKIRENNYESLRNVDLQPKKLINSNFEDLSIDVISYQILHDSHLILKSIKEIDLRRNTGASIIAIKRGDNIIQSPSADERLELEDIVYITGTHEVIQKAIKFLDEWGNIEFNLEREN
jgi:CPA2 family monovalent cation:H+ antiporter-2